MTMALTQISDNGLTNTGVTAATYGSSSAIPSLTIDAKGRVTSATTSAIDSTSISNGTSNVSVASGGDITVTRAGSTALTFTGNGPLLPDSQEMRFGNGADLRIFHDGSNSYIKDIGTGGLILETNGHAVDIKHGSEYCARFKEDADVELYYDNSVKLETKSDGVNIIGELECDSLDVDGSADFAGNIVINGANYNAAWDYSTSKLKFNDNAKAAFGTSSDLQIYHTGSHSFIEDTGTGGLYIRGASTIGFRDAANSFAAFADFNSGESVELYYNGFKKFATKTDGIDVEGEVQCDSLDVDGAGDISGDLTVGGVIKGTGTAFEVGYFPNSSNQTAAVKRIRMTQGGELHFGDTTTASFLGITEGTVNQFTDTDRIGIYYRNNLDIYSTNNTRRWGWDINGHYVPATNNAIDIGSSSNRVRNIYTNDMNLSNEGSANDVDGTWGSYTIQEGEDDLFLINRRSGKKYKFNLTEVN